MIKINAHKPQLLLFSIIYTFQSILLSFVIIVGLAIDGRDIPWNNFATEIVSFMIAGISSIVIVRLAMAQQKRRNNAT